MEGRKLTGYTRPKATLRGDCLDAAGQIELVRENLAVAIAMRRSAGMGLINVSFVAHFGGEETRDSAEAPAALHVQDNEELCRCANNQIRAAFGYSVQITHGILERAFGTAGGSSARNDQNDACCVLRLLAGTLEANPMAPAWVCPVGDRRRFSVEAAGFGLDARTLHGRELLWSDFGGLQKYLDLLAFCAEAVEEAGEDAGPSRNSDGVPEDDEGSVEDGGFIEEEPVGEPAAGTQEARAQERTTSESGTENEVRTRAMASPRTAADPDTGLVSAFVEETCMVGDEEMVLAADLFSTYVEWCAKQGAEPVGQRRFGMYLTAAGLERKRRGRGKHWWMGVGLREVPAAVV